MSRDEIKKVLQYYDVSPISKKEIDMLHPYLAPRLLAMYGEESNA